MKLPSDLGFYSKGNKLKIKLGNSKRSWDGEVFFNVMFIEFCSGNIEYFILNF